MHFWLISTSGWGIMLDIGLSSKNSWKNSSPLFIGCYSFFSSTCFDVEIDYNCSSMIGWGPIFTSSSDYEITITCAVGFVVEIIIFKKFSVVFNSPSNSLLLYSCSKTRMSFVVGACEASGYT
jgi:hypothetical protein